LTLRKLNSATRRKPMVQAAGILDVSGGRRQTAPMKHFTIAACLFFGLAASALLAAELPAPIAPTERMDLFNGKDFSGWTFCLRSNAPPADTYTVSNGLMHCTGQPFGYARTDKSFRDYKLTVEWRYVKIAARADNGGVFVHVNPPDQVWPLCIENQGQYHHQGDFIFMGGAMFTGTNGLKQGQIRMKAQQNEQAAGEWNTYEVVCRSNTVMNYVNGRLMNEVAGCNASSGAIAVQSEGGEWELRKIYIEPLPNP
jgi:hypothetical protein